MKRTLRKTRSRESKVHLQKIKVLIVDDHRLIREGLRVLLKLENNQYNFIVEEATSGEAAIEKVKKNNFDIVLMDYQLPTLNGAETTRILLSLKPNVNVLALSNYDERAIINSFQKAGVKGYVLKNNIEAEELFKSITIILNGKKYYSNEIAARMGETKETESGKKLCARECDILELIAQSHTSRQIADKLFLSKRTIDKYRGKLLAKMQVRNTAGLLIQAKKLKLID